MSEHEYINLRREKLEAFGANYICDVIPGHKLSEIDRTIAYERWGFNGVELLLTRGCAGYADSESRYRDEFIIHCGEGNANHLLDMAAFFHITCASIKPADLLKLNGDGSADEAGYTHIFASVPFFFPRDINEIIVSGIVYGMQWLMPLFRDEASFVESEGSDKFEEKLNKSQYDFFDKRLNLNYLN